MGWALVILFSTVTPSGTGRPEPWSSCLVCGDRGTADAIANLLLFLPLGLTLRIGGWSALSILGVATLLSGSIELLQQWIPARYPTVGDVLFNAVGAVAGAALADGRKRLRRRDPSLATLAAAVCVGTLLLAGRLARLDLTAAAYFGQWTRELGEMEIYQGRVLAASVGTMPLPDARIPDAATVRSSLARDAVLRIVAVAGPAPVDLAPLFSIHDELERLVVLVGVDQGDLVVRHGALARRVRVTAPEIRWSSVLAPVPVGDTFRVEVALDRRRVALIHGRATRDTTFPARMADGWTLIGDPGLGTSHPSALPGLLWVALLAIPIGYWSCSPLRLGALVGAAAVVLALAPPALGVAPGSWVEYTGMVAGAGIGWLLGARVNARGRSAG